MALKEFKISDIDWLMDDTEDLIDSRSPKFQASRTIKGAKGFIEKWKMGILEGVNPYYILKRIAKFNDFIEHNIRQ